MGSVSKVGAGVSNLMATLCVALLRITSIAVSLVESNSASFGVSFHMLFPSGRVLL